MALGSALVDRARVVRNETATTTRVEGSSVVSQVHGNWFRARLELPQGSEGSGTSQEQGRTRGVSSPTLMYELLDEENLRVEMTGEDFVQVESDEFGTTTWQMQGNPQPIRKLRAVIGFQASVRKVEQRELVRPIR